MVTDLNVRKLRCLDRQGVSKDKAAARAGIDPKTARKYRQLGRLPSEVRLMDRERERGQTPRGKKRGQTRSKSRTYPIWIAFAPFSLPPFLCPLFRRRSR